ncbi:hypothetical protein, conserved [Eimeria brunetti]|uniref:Uncharacterized protein n=1 Tax=Eimeria brunetti TaxID=51314 RepID=U6LPD8_9EIME|nr:hypothetical protein, conserved [Eimeria brunetti]
MARFMLLHGLLLFLFAGAYTAVTAKGLCCGRQQRSHSAGFLQVSIAGPSSAWPASTAPCTPVFGRDPVSFVLSAASKAPGLPQGASNEAPLLTFVDWGRGRTAPGSAEELLHQQQLPEQQRSKSNRHVSGLLYCTSWDPRSKALVSAIRLLQQDATGTSEDSHDRKDEQPKLPQYPILGIKVTNSLVIARSRRALAKQRRMACNMKQLRHNERALRFMLQQQPPLQLRGLPALQLYTQQQLHQEPQQQQGEGVAPWKSSMQQLLEIRALGPRTLKRLGEDEGALLGAWGHEGPPGGPREAVLLGAWLRRLGQLYEDKLKQVVEERLQQAEEEYPIYTSYNP